jgi:hypothetical protein
MNTSNIKKPLQRMLIRGNLSGDTEILRARQADMMLPLFRALLCNGGLWTWLLPRQQTIGLPSG